MNVDTAAKLVQSSFRHPYVLKCYKEGDANSSNQTKHDISHADEVLNLALRLVAQVEEVFPDLLDEWTKHVIIPLGAFLHDIGRCIDVDTHDVAGAKWAMDFLQNHLKTDTGETLPLDTIKRVARIIACHRTNRYVKVKFTDHALDIVLIADKCVGDEERVRPGRARILRALTWFGKAHWGDNLRVGGIHDRINFAIKKAQVDRDDRTFVLRIDLDERVCLPDEVYGLYGDRFHCCVIAARKMGFGFELEFNGVPMTEAKEGTWQAK